MKKMKILLLILPIFLYACNSPESKETDKTSMDKNNPEGSYGEIITKGNAKPADSIVELLGEKDSVQVKLMGNISASCQGSGCWMDVDIGDGETVHVTFKDNAFVIPKDSKDKTVFFKGIATKELVPVETLKNYAREEGKSKEEIESITEPRYAYNFEASGILILDK